MVDISNKRLDELRKSFDGKRIAVFGDMMLDGYFWGDVKRISPEAPVPVLEVDLGDVPGPIPLVEDRIDRRLAGRVVGLARNAHERARLVDLMPEPDNAAGDDHHHHEKECE